MQPSYWKQAEPTPVSDGVSWKLIFIIHFHVDMGRWSPRLALTFFTPHSLYILYTIGYCVIQEVVSHGELIGNFTSVSKFKIDRHQFQP